MIIERSRSRKRNILHLIIRAGDTAELVIDGKVKTVVFKGWTEVMRREAWSDTSLPPPELVRCVVVKCVEKDAE